MEKLEINTVFNNTTTEHIVDYGKIESVTAQEYEVLTDIKSMIAQQNIPLRTPVYGEETRMTFEDWQNERAALMRRWDMLTSELKARFGTPSAFLEYCADMDNYERYEGELMLKEQAYKLKVQREQEAQKAQEAQKTETL